MSPDGQDTKWRRNIAENFNRLSRVHERYRQTTDGRATAYSEREFAFAKNRQLSGGLSVHHGRPCTAGRHTKRWRHCRTDSSLQCVVTQTVCTHNVQGI